MNTQEVIEAMVKSGKYQELVAEYSEGQLEACAGSPSVKVPFPEPGGPGNCVLSNKQNSVIL